MRKKQTKYKEVSHLNTVFSGRVKFNDADPLGIVWHGNYIGYFEEGREDFGRMHGISYLDIHENDFTTPIVKSTCDHKLPLKYGDTFTVETAILNTPAAKMIFRYEIFNQDNLLVCSGETIQAFVHIDGDLSLYPPKFYEEWKEKVKFNK
jgi:acyl-CoA thioester hydrolase